ncbi:hypothetical protein PZB74_22265 [Porifericola rhodea]|uniref:hypothetical protein n=1 Tax=Porifericola rhodea TaxID=930972 RepID=UPI002666AE14|nr:hypothetical protein [Porifericola rhodea]WKN31675.1 hypothetical protein PZB74_22265 [Porifericola rhodea]
MLHQDFHPLGRPFKELYLPFKAHTFHSLYASADCLASGYGSRYATSEKEN